MRDDYDEVSSVFEIVPPRAYLEAEEAKAEEERRDRLSDYEFQILLRDFKLGRV